jgi:hypothetical protein
MNIADALGNVGRMLSKYVAYFIAIIGMVIVLFVLIGADGPDVAPVVLQPNPLATEHLPMFTAGPGQTDVFFNIVVVILLIVSTLIGVFYFALHALPERLAHKYNSRQLQIVAILSLVGMFTSNNYLWIAALLLASIKIPDFITPINSIARSLDNKYGQEK